MTEGVGEILSTSWQEYKGGFRVFLVLSLIFILIPALLTLIFSIHILNDAPDSLLQSLSNSNHYMDLTDSVGDVSAVNAEYAEFISQYWGILIGLIIFSAILSFILGICLIYNSLYNKNGKMTVSQTIKGGFSYFWSYLGLSVIFLLFIIVVLILPVISLFLFRPLAVPLFIIAFIISALMFIYWMLAPYVLVGENKGIMESFSRSKELIKGKWWRTFGYLLFFVLILILIQIVLGIPTFIYALTMLGGITKSGLTTQYIINFIFGFIQSLIITPLSILYLKNYYLDVNTRGKK